MITKTTFTRRRATGITLGTVLGVGIIPSMSRKLKATDQSSAPRPPGVKYTVSTHPAEAPKVALWEGFSTMVQETKKDNIPVGGINLGNLTRTLNVQFSAAPNVCNSTLIVVITKIIRLVLNEPAGPWIAEQRETTERRYKCVAGLPLVEYENIQATDDPIAPDLMNLWAHFVREDGEKYPFGTPNKWILKEVNGDAPGPPGHPKIMPVLVGPTPALPPIAPFGTINFGVVCCAL